jgi:hypothetical protein
MVKFSLSLKLRITSFLLTVLSIATAFLSKREDNAPIISRMYLPPKVYYAQEYLLASGLMLVSALILLILSFRKTSKNKIETKRKK